MVIKIFAELSHYKFLFQCDSVITCSSSSVTQVITWSLSSVAHLLHVLLPVWLSHYRFFCKCDSVIPWSSGSVTQPLHVLLPVWLSLYVLQCDPVIAYSSSSVTQSLHVHLAVWLSHYMVFYHCESTILFQCSSVMVPLIVHSDVV